jgi:PiT family inorganic phosphate transporter
VARSILTAWVLTFPAAGVVAAALYWLLKNVLQLP